MAFRLFLFVALAAALLVWACGDGDDALAPQTPQATEEAFNRTLLSGVMLRPEDVGSGFRAPKIESVGGTESQGLTVTYQDAGVSLRATVTRFESAPVLDAAFVRTRRSLVAVGAQEENLDLDGADIAFTYTLDRPGGQISWAAADNYTMYLQIGPVDPDAPDARASDSQEFLRLTRLMAERVRNLIEDPAAITPAPELSLPTMPAADPAATP